MTSLKEITKSDPTDQISKQHPTSSLSKVQRQQYPVLDGVRALLTLWVVVFHTAWTVAMFLPREQFESFAGSTPLIVMSGLNAVDWFFVLTGLLLSQPILAGQRTGSWFDFVYLRLSRIYPLLIFSTVFFCAVVQRMDTIPFVSWELHSSDALRPVLGFDSPGIPSLCDKSWATLLFINNFLPFGGCMGWTWSLAIQVQFIFIFPLLLKWFGTGPRLVKFCLGLGLVGLVIRALLLVGLVQSYEWTNPPQLYIWNVEYLEQFLVLFNVWYSSTIQRIGGCFAGVLLAWVHVNQPKWAETIKTSKTLSYAFTGLSLLFLSYSTNPDLFESFPTLIFTVGGVGHWFAICFILFGLLNQLHPFRFLAKLLSHKIFASLAYPSYCVYLIHPYMITWIERQPELVPGEGYGKGTFLLHVTLVLATTYSISYLATRFIEEPVKALMRNYLDPVACQKGTEDK